MEVCQSEGMVLHGNTRREALQVCSRRCAACRQAERPQNGSGLRVHRFGDHARQHVIRIGAMHEPWPTVVGIERYRDLGHRGQCNYAVGGVGTVNCRIAPRGSFALAHNSPPCAWMIERQIDSPNPRPLGLVE